MGYSTKGRSGQVGKTKEKIMHIAKKTQGETLVNRKGNKRLSKTNNQWHLIQKR
jgi:hypothetical protein